MNEIVFLVEKHSLYALVILRKIHKVLTKSPNLYYYNKQLKKFNNTMIL